MTKVGIDKISFHVPKSYLDIVDLAHHRGVDPNKYKVGIGQDKMAVPRIEEDIISMAANAANNIINDEDRQQIDQILFATESSFDYSKSSAIYLHELLNIQPYAKSVELKQACYSGTAALMQACDYVRLRPDRKVLVVTSDISRYGLNSGGEPTQGAGAVAFVVSSHPRILAIDLESISVTRNEFDFWRPDHHSFPLVEGKFSTELYLEMFNQVMLEFEKQYPIRISELYGIAFHIPFTKMGMKALKAYQELEDTAINDSLKAKLVDNWINIYPASTVLNRQVGNIYTGSLYLSLISLLLFAEDLKANERIGLFSYGSGAVAELITGTIQNQYLSHLNKEEVMAHLYRRNKISVEEYEIYYNEQVPNVDNYQVSQDNITHYGFYLSEVNQFRRCYKYNPEDRRKEHLR